MAFCRNCGTEVQDEIKFCPSCGGSVGETGQQTSTVSSADPNKGMAVLAYIIFFIPLLTGDYKKSDYVKYHTNQGTVLGLLAIAYSILSSILRAIIKVRTDYGWGLYYSHTPGWLSTILWLGNLAIFALCILGIYYAATNKMKELPVIGKFKIIK